MSPKNETDKLNVRAGIASLIVATILFSIKIVTGILTNSIAIMASAADSAFDLVSSGVNFYAIKHAQKPADQGHRFGHGKAEALAGFMQSIIIFGSGFYLIYKSIYRLFVPEEISKINEGLIVMGVSILLTWFLTIYQSYVHKKSKSLVIAADRLHYVTDLLSNGVVMISLLLSKFFEIRYIDALAGLGIALFIIKSSTDIFKQSFDILMDKDISDKYRDDLINIIDTISPDVLGYHDLRSRCCGDMDFIEFHLEVPKNLTVKDSHELVEKTMMELNKIHSNAEIIIHTDPAEYDAKIGKIRVLDRDKPRFY